jgi:hypothetical protein
MGWGLARLSRSQAWIFALIGALSLAACEPGNEDAERGPAAEPEGPSGDEPPEDLSDAGEPDAERPASFVDAGAAGGPPPGDASALNDAAPRSDASSGSAPEAALPEAAPPVDLCGDVPTAGRCRDARNIELCAVATGMGEDHVETHACASDEQCTQVAGRAMCVLAQGCIVGTTRCTGGALETCAGERWEQEACSTECVATPLGAFCAAEAPTRRFQGRVEYERRLPNAKLNDWASASLTPARGFLILSYHQDELVDAVLSTDSASDPGAFSVRVREPATGQDSLVVLAAGAAETQEIAFAIANPGLTPSSKDQAPGTRSDKAALWSFRFGLADVAQSGTLTILEKHGSAACHAFDRLRQIYLLGSEHYRPAKPESIVIWLGIGTQWSCGACTTWSPVKAFDTRFEHQIWLDGSRDQGYWSDAVTAHELGHYVMNAYGFPVGEGGPHFLGVPTHPGQAFSEGWATFFSSMARADSIYVDKQGGAFFWWDLDRRAYSTLGALWARALASLGLLQLMDENEAAAIMWQSYRTIGKREPMLDAVASDRMLVPPFARGYLRRIWSDAENPDEYQSTQQPLPCLADYLDALRCSDAVSAEAMRSIVEPIHHYPYPSESPLCD